MAKAKTKSVLDTLTGGASGLEGLYFWAGVMAGSRGGEVRSSVCGDYYLVVYFDPPRDPHMEVVHVGSMADDGWVFFPDEDSWRAWGEGQVEEPPDTPPSPVAA